MSEVLTDDASAADVELSGRMQKLNMADETISPEKKGDNSPQTIGADEAKDSESGPAKSSNQPVKGRVFVGGISWRTTDTELREYFGKFGEIKDCLVCKDQWTGKSRGFGFLSFEDPGVAEMLISETHTIGGRTVQVKTAVPKSNNISQADAPRITAGQNRTKLFVGGLHRSVNNKEFRAYFESFGELTDAFIMYNMQSKRSRGFGFVTFVDQECAQKCLHERHAIRGKPVELKVAIPREVIGSSRHKRKMRPQRQQQRVKALYDGGWPHDVNPTGVATYGHALPTGPQMISPPCLQPTSDSTIPQQHTPGTSMNARAGPFDQWVPSVIPGRPAAGMAAGMYSQDVYYGGFPHGMNPYGYGYHVPMYGAYSEVPAGYDPSAGMYDPTAPTPYDPNASNFPIPPPSTVPANPGVPSSNTTVQSGDAPPNSDLEPTQSQNTVTDTS